LTVNDWQEILQSASCPSFTKDRVIVQEGFIDNNLYQVRTGQCRIEKTMEYGKFLLGTISENEIFGEICFLERNGSFASVIADSSVVEVFVIEATILDSLFRSHPSLGGRFYFHLCGLLSDRLKLRHTLDCTSFLSSK